VMACSCSARIIIVSASQVNDLGYIR